MISVHLDWLRYTIPWDSAQTELENISRARPEGELSQFTGEEIDIGQGFNHGLRMMAGQVFWHDTRQEQGISIQLNGEDLQVYRQAGAHEIDILRYAHELGGHVTTMHACINVHNIGADVSDLIKEHEAGTLRTKARNIGVYSSKTKVNSEWKTGDTLYVGSAKSERQIRVYNKAAEQGIEADWVRLEIVWRGPYAKAAHLGMLNVGIEAVTRTEIGIGLGSDAAWYAEALHGEVAPAIVIPRKESGRARWLREVVIPALRSELEEERKTGGADMLVLFSETINEFLNSDTD
jgi:hypothetical protein